jgi:hypothetical protein
VGSSFDLGIAFWYRLRIKLFRSILRQQIFLGVGCVVVVVVLGIIEVFLFFLDFLGCIKWILFIDYDFKCICRCF